MMDWNGQPIQHMSTSHIINTMAWLWRIMMHKKFDLMATKYAENILGQINPKQVEEWGESFMDQFDIEDAQAKIDVMARELARRKRATR